MRAALIEPAPCPGEMTIKDFIKKFDLDGDGRISKAELREAIRAAGGWFSWWKANRGARFADTDGNGFIDDYEIKNLVDLAKKELGIKIVVI